MSSTFVSDTTVESTEAKDLVAFRKKLYEELSKDDRLFGHRELVDSIDLSKLGKEAPRHIEVAFRAPSIVEILDEKDGMIGNYVRHGADASKFYQAMDDVVEGFLEAQKSGEWKSERKEGNVTVSFSEIPRDQKHPANPSDEAMVGVPYLDEQDIVAVNGRALNFEDKSDLVTHFKEIVEAVDSVKIVEAGQKPFAPVISIVGDGVAAAAEHDQLNIGVKLLEMSVDDPLVGRGFIRHEQGHIVNDDPGYNSLHSGVLGNLSDFNLALPLLESIDESPEWTAERIADTTSNNRQAFKMLDEFDAALTAITPQVAETADTLREYPEFDKLSAKSVAKNLNGEGSLVKHLESAEAPRDVESLADINRFTGSLSLDEDDIYAHVNNDKRAEALQAKVEEIGAKHGALLEDLLDINKAAGFISQARELLADKHAVEHAEDPMTIVNGIKKMAANGVPDGGHDGATHPSHKQRIKEAEGFAEKLLRKREQTTKSGPQK